MNEIATSPIAPPSRRAAQVGEPAWDVAMLFPMQGEWTEADYLALDGTRMIELSDGCLEVLPMATIWHQFIVQFLFLALDGFVKARNLGRVVFAPLPVRLWVGKYREPDLIFLGTERLRDTTRYPHGAELAVEVVSEDEESRERDLETKRDEYARAAISEYWIVDPAQQRITVLTLDGATYRVHGEFGPGSRATSVLLQGFDVSVDEVFAAGRPPNP